MVNRFMVGIAFASSPCRFKHWLHSSVDVSVNTFELSNPSCSSLWAANQVSLSGLVGDDADPRLGGAKFLFRPVADAWFVLPQICLALSKHHRTSKVFSCIQDFHEHWMSFMSILSTMFPSSSWVANSQMKSDDRSR